MQTFLLYFSWKNLHAFSAVVGVVVGVAVALHEGIVNGIFTLIAVFFAVSFLLSLTRLGIVDEIEKRKRRALIAAEKQKLLREEEAARSRAMERYAKVLEQLHAAPGDRVCMSELLNIATNYPHVREHLYSHSLQLLELDGGSTEVRVFALDAGRLYLGGLRPDGLCTLYDEQSINNDIITRVRIA